MASRLEFSMSKRVNEIAFEIYKALQLENGRTGKTEFCPEEDVKGLVDLSELSICFGLGFLVESGFIEAAPGHKIRIKYTNHMVRIPE
jgi:hypothetical protein